MLCSTGSAFMRSFEYFWNQPQLQVCVIENHVRQQDRRQTMRLNGRSGPDQWIRKVHCLDSVSNYSGEDKKEAVGGGSVDKDRICGLPAAYGLPFTVFLTLASSKYLPLPAVAVIRGDSSRLDHIDGLDKAFRCKYCNVDSRPLLSEFDCNLNCCKKFE